MVSFTQRIQFSATNLIWTLIFCIKFNRKVFFGAFVAQFTTKIWDLKQTDEEQRVKWHLLCEKYSLANKLCTIMEKKFTFKRLKCRCIQCARDRKKVSSQTLTLSLIVYMYVCVCVNMKTFGQERTCDAFAIFFSHLNCPYALQSFHYTRTTTQIYDEYFYYNINSRENFSHFKRMNDQPNCTHS